MWNWGFLAGGPLNFTGPELINHRTSKISAISLLIKISLCVFLIRGFQGGIGDFKHGGSRMSTRVGLLNH
jgi:hypothetical protein